MCACARAHTRLREEERHGAECRCLPWIRLCSPSILLSLLWLYHRGFEHSLARLGPDRTDSAIAEKSVIANQVC